MSLSAKHLPALIVILYKIIMSMYLNVGSGAGIYSDAAQMYTEQNSRENTREKINFSASPDHDTSKSIEVRDFAQSSSSLTRSQRSCCKQDQHLREIEMEEFRIEISGEASTCTLTHFSIEYTGELKDQSECT